jgi:hypothetical protein
VVGVFPACPAAVIQGINPDTDTPAPLVKLTKRDMPIALCIIGVLPHFHRRSVVRVLTALNSSVRVILYHCLSRAGTPFALDCKKPATVVVFPSLQMTVGHSKNESVNRLPTATMEKARC